MSNKSHETSTPEALRTQVGEILAAFTHPTLNHPLSALKALHHCALLDNTLHIELLMPFAWQSGFAALKDATSAELLRVSGAKAIEWRLAHNIATLKRANDQAGVKGVRNIIAVSSGKGGVGKSSTAVNLALALAAEGAKVGILDADIYGPSIPMMLGTPNERPTSPDGQHMAPIMAHGLATNSIGYLVTDDNAMVWRGPMASKALLQLLQDTLWPDLDYLVLDMPPGTGDIQLTLAQNIPVTGAVVVTTPQDIALLDAMKGIVMFEKVHVPVLGVVENMSIHVCSNCGFMNLSLAPVVLRNWRKNTRSVCWASYRCIFHCVKIWIAVNRRWHVVQTVNLRIFIVSWRRTLQRSYTGRANLSRQKSPSARCNSP